MSAKKKRDFDSLFENAVEDSDELFRLAFAGGDVEGLALAGLALDYEGFGAAPRFRAIVDALGAAPLVSAALLGCAERADELHQGLVTLVFELIGEKHEELDLEPAQVERLADVVGKNQLPPDQRVVAFDWLLTKAEDKALDAAVAITRNESQPFDAVDKRVLRFLGGSRKTAASEALLEYAERYLATDQQARVLEAVQAIRKLPTLLTDRLGKVFVETAKKGWALPKTYLLTTKLTNDQIKVVATILTAGGQESWLHSHFLASGLSSGRKLIPLLAAEGMPVGARRFLAGADWSRAGDQLFVSVAAAAAKWGDETALEASRSAIANRCQATKTQGRVGKTRMPRLGARILIGQALRGEIATNNSHLRSALDSLDPQDRVGEYEQARWLRTERAATMGCLVASTDPNEIVRLFAGAHSRLSDEAARRFIEEIQPQIDEDKAQRLVAIVYDSPVQLKALVEQSEEAAKLVLSSWKTDNDLRAFDALADSESTADALAHVPDVVTEYSNGLSADESRRLLAALPATLERAGLLLSVLRDRTNPRGARPGDDDLLNCLDLLDHHFEQELVDEVEALGVLEEVCSGARQVEVRKRTYRLLAKAQPSPRLVDLLFERRESETRSVRPEVESALTETARKLTRAAGDHDDPTRLQAVQLLGRIDGQASAAHARELLSEPDVEARVVAAEELGAHGEQADADLLEAAMTEEPSPEVRRAGARAVRRLKVGDAAAAHEHLGELLQPRDRERWDALDPRAVYGDWVDALVLGLDRLIQAENDGQSGAAIDHLNEVAKALLFRAIGLVGDDAGLKLAYRQKVASNAENYGSVLRNGQLLNRWHWVSTLSALYDLRTAHVAERGSTTTPPERTPDDLRAAKTLFRHGALPCAEKIVDATAARQS